MNSIIFCTFKILSLSTKMRCNIKSIIAFTYVAITYQSNARPILSIDKTDMPRLEKRIVIPAPSPITFSSMGRASTPSKTVATTTNDKVDTTTTKTSVSTNETGSRIVAKTTNTEGAAEQERTSNTIDRLPRTQSTSSTTTKATNGKSGSGTTTSSTLNSPTNLELHTP